MVKRIILFWCWPEEEDGPRMKVIVLDKSVFYMKCPFCGRRALSKDGIHRWKEYDCRQDYF